MRAGGSCSLQQALTPEATALIKQAVTLAKRRGHGQVTPLHVAATMLTVSAGLLRAACLRSHSHPLQCKALELCFNVALNRLPAAASSPMFGIHGAVDAHHHHHIPSISNALIAAFKRAQAHQRRGSIETNQSLLAVKIELDQLVVSILDDPSVSRVMREAGFSSSQVKSNVERPVSSETSPTSSSSPHDTNPRDTNLNIRQSSNTPRLPPSSKNASEQDHTNPSSPVRDEDVMHVMENLLEKKRRSVVIVGECADTIEGVVRGLTDKLRNGTSSDNVAQPFKDVQFINLSLPSFEHLSRQGVEQKLGDLRAHLLRSDHMMMGNDDNNTGVILFLGDLKWIAENRANAGVDHLATELGKLICEVGDSDRVWVMGIATLQSYMRCKSGYPSLESLWRLHPFAVPAGSLSFSLIADSDIDIGCSSIKKCQGGSWLLPLGTGDEHLTCCYECSSEFDKEARSLRSSAVNSNLARSTSSLPPWLQQCKDEKNAFVSHINDDRDCARELRRKWNSICNMIHRQSQSSQRALNFSSLSTSPSSSGFSYELPNPNTKLANRMRVMGYSRITGQSETVNLDPSPSRRNSPHNSGSSSDDVMEIEYCQRFKEPRERNMELMIEKLEEKVPWQKHVTPEIVATILRCRSGMAKRKGNVKEDDGEVKNETWFLFQGVDRDGKERIARELARLVFGSYNSLVLISLSSWPSGNEKSRSEFEEFPEALTENPHRVFFIEDIAEADHNFREHFKRAIEKGKFTKASGDEADLKDAIVILSHGSLTPRSISHPPVKQNMGYEEEEESPSLSLDLNISIAHGSLNDDQYHSNIAEFTEYVDKLILFEIQG